MLSNCGVREDSWKSLDCKRIKPVNPKGNKLWIFIARTGTEAKAPILWPPNGNSLKLTEKAPDARKDWRQEEKGTTEDKLVGWHHWLNGHEFEQTPGVGEGQGSLACCSPWGHRVRHDWTTNIFTQSDAIVDYPVLWTTDHSFSISNQGQKGATATMEVH